MRRILILSAAVLSLCVSGFAAGELSNRRAPGFSLPDVNLQQHDLADYRGKVVIVDVMKTACPHCTTFAKKLTEVEKKYAGQVKVLAIVHPPDNQASVKKYLADNALSITTLFDCYQVAAAYLKLGPRNPSFDVPHFFVVDKTGRIVEDYGYNMLARGIFEGDGLYPILDRYVSKPVQAD